MIAPHSRFAFSMPSGQNLTVPGKSGPHIASELDGPDDPVPMMAGILELDL
jgi:hypothetical protein